MQVLKNKFNKKTDKVRDTDKTLKNHHIPSCEKPAAHSSRIHHLCELSLTRMNQSKDWKTRKIVRIGKPEELEKKTPKNHIMAGCEEHVAHSCKIHHLHKSSLPRRSQTENNPQASYTIELSDIIKKKWIKLD
jgi:hypothetical protein